MQEGFDGLLRDKTRPSRINPLGDEIAARIVALTLEDPPFEATHWTGAMMAKTAGVSVSSVQRIWRTHGLAPHRVRQFKLSNDPKFIDKLRDVVGLYVNPPAHAIVLSVDEKSQIQALDRTQPGLPLKKGRAGTMTHDYKRHGTTTLFAALNVLDGTVIGRNMQRHRHQEFVRFLNTVEAEVPAGKVVHAIVDNYAAHKHPKVRKWLTAHPRWTWHTRPDQGVTWRFDQSAILRLDGSRGSNGGSKMGRLTKARIARLRAKGCHLDGDGLYLQVSIGTDGTPRKSWLFRFMSPTMRKERYMGLGALADVRWRTRGSRVLRRGRLFGRAKTRYPNASALTKPYVRLMR